MKVVILGIIVAILGGVGFVLISVSGSEGVPDSVYSSSDNEVSLDDSEESLPPVEDYSQPDEVEPTVSFPEPQEDVVVEEVPTPSVEQEAETVASVVEELPEPIDEIAESAPEPQNLSVTKVVTYTSNGFSPETVTISVGDTIKFVDDSTGRMYVSSDSHPTHNNYPGNSEAGCSGSGFDQCETGPSYTFVFNEPGTHKYHNHIRASHGGSIIVN